MQIFEDNNKKPVKAKPGTQYDLIDRAASGDVEAAAKLAEGYLKGLYECEKNPAKGKKWAQYAAKKGSALGQQLLEEDLGGVAGGAITPML